MPGFISAKTTSKAREFQPEIFNIIEAMILYFNKHYTHTPRGKFPRGSPLESATLRADIAARFQKYIVDSAKEILRTHASSIKYVQASYNRFKYRLNGKNIKLEDVDKHTFLALYKAWETDFSRLTATKPLSSAPSALQNMGFTLEHIYLRTMAINTAFLGVTAEFDALERERARLLRSDSPPAEVEAVQEMIAAKEDDILARIDAMGKDFNNPQWTPPDPVSNLAATRLAITEEQLAGVAARINQDKLASALYTGEANVSKELEAQQVVVRALEEKIRRQQEQIETARGFWDSTKEKVTRLEAEAKSKVELQAKHDRLTNRYKELVEELKRIEQIMADSKTTTAAKEQELKAQLEKARVELQTERAEWESTRLDQAAELAERDRLLKISEAAASDTLRQMSDVRKSQQAVTADTLSIQTDLKNLAHDRGKFDDAVAAKNLEFERREAAMKAEEDRLAALRQQQSKAEEDLRGREVTVEENTKVWQKNEELLKLGADNLSKLQSELSQKQLALNARQRELDEAMETAERVIPETEAARARLRELETGQLELEQEYRVLLSRLLAAKSEELASMKAAAEATTAQQLSSALASLSSDSQRGQVEMAAAQALERKFEEAKLEQRIQLVESQIGIELQFLDKYDQQQRAMQEELARLSRGRTAEELLRISESEAIRKLMGIEGDAYRQVMEDEATRLRLRELEEMGPKQQDWRDEQTEIIKQEIAERADSVSSSLRSRTQDVEQKISSIVSSTEALTTERDQLMSRLHSIKTQMSMIDTGVTLLSRLQRQQAVDETRLTEISQIIRNNETDVAALRTSIGGDQSSLSSISEREARISQDLSAALARIESARLTLSVRWKTVVTIETTIIQELATVAQLETRPDLGMVETRLREDRLQLEIQQRTLTATKLEVETHEKTIERLTRENARLESERVTDAEREALRKARAAIVELTAERDIFKQLNAQMKSTIGDDDRYQAIISQGVERETGLIADLKARAEEEVKLRLRAEALERDLKFTRETVEARETELAKLAAVHDNIVKNNMETDSALGAQLTSARRELETLTRRHDTAVARYETRVSELESRLMVEPARDVALLNDEARLRSQLTVQENRVSSLEGVVSSRDSRIAALQREREQSELEIIELQGKLANAAAKTRDLESLVVSRERSIANLTDTIADRSARISALQIVNQTSQESVATLTGECLQLQQTTTRAEDAVLVSDRRLATVREELSLESGRLSTVRAELSSTTELAARLQRERDSRQTQVAQLTAEVETKTKLAESLSLEQAKRDDIIRQLQEEHGKRERELAELAREVAAKNAHAETLDARVSDLQNQVSTLNTEIMDRGLLADNLKLEVSARNTTISTLQEKTKALGLQIVSRETMIETLQKEVIERNAIAVELETIAAEDKVRRESLEREVGAKALAIAELETNISQLNASVQTEIAETQQLKLVVANRDLTIGQLRTALEASETMEVEAEDRERELERKLVAAQEHVVRLEVEKEMMAQTIESTSRVVTVARASVSHSIGLIKKDVEDEATPPVNKSVLPDGDGIWKAEGRSARIANLSESESILSRTLAKLVPMLQQTGIDEVSRGVQIISPSTIYQKTHQSKLYILSRWRVPSLAYVLFVNLAKKTITRYPLY